MKKTLALLILLFPLAIQAQIDSSQSAHVYKTEIKVSESIPKSVYLVGDSKPQFPGGPEAMNNYIAEQLKYPVEAINNQTSGRVKLKFIIDSIGKICCINYIGENSGYGFEEEAIRIFRQMPLWIPATLRNRPVAVYYQLVVGFQYQEE